MSSKLCSKSCDCGSDCSVNGVKFSSSQACSLALGAQCDPTKSDIDYGAWQFKTLASAKKADADLFAAWFTAPQLVRFPGGESLQDVAARAANALRFVLARHPRDTVVLVGHDSVNRALL